MLSGPSTGGKVGGSPFVILLYLEIGEEGIIHSSLLEVKSQYNKNNKNYICIFLFMLKRLHKLLMKETHSF